MHVEMAAREPKGPVGRNFLDEAAARLHMPRTREDMPLPEPVDTLWLNGRPPGGWQTCFPFAQLPPAGGGWEEDAIAAGRQRERRAETVLLTGTGGS